MKKIFIIGLLLLCGCVKASDTYYVDIIEEISSVNESTELPCDIEVSIVDLGNDEIYYVTFDNPKLKMFDIKALVVGGEDVSSIGFLDEPVNMEIGNIDKDSGYVKGIILSGYMSSETLKIYIEYEGESGELIKNYYIHQNETK